MKRLIGYTIMVGLAVFLSACAKHYRQALDAYHRAEPIPFYQRTQDWIDEAEEPAVAAAPVSARTLTADALTTTASQHDTFLRLAADLLNTPTSALEIELDDLRTTAQIEQALSDRVEWEELQRIVLLRNPSVRAAGERWQATVNQYSQAEFLEELINTFRGFTRYLNVKTGKPLNKEMLKQFFPYPSTIALKGEMIREQLRLAEIEWQKTMRDAVLEAGNQYFEYQYLFRAEEATRDNVALSENLLRTVEERYKVNEATQADFLKIQTQLERLKNMVSDLLTQQRARAAEINALIDRSPSAPLGPPSEDDVPAVTVSLDELIAQALGQRQEIRMEETKVDRIQVAIRLGEVMNRPLFSQGYSAFERGMMPEASVSESRPPFGVRAKTSDQPAYAQAEAYLAEMRQRLDAQQSSAAQARAQARGMAQAVLENLDEALRQVELVESIVLPQDRSTYQITLTNYTTGAATFLDLLDAERALIDSRLELHRSRRDLNKMRLQAVMVRGRF